MYPRCQDWNVTVCHRNSNIYSVVSFLHKKLDDSKTKTTMNAIQQRDPVYLLLTILSYKIIKNSKKSRLSRTSTEHHVLPLRFDLAIYNYSLFSINRVHTGLSRKSPRKLWDIPKKKNLVFQVTYTAQTQGKSHIWVYQAPKPMSSKVRWLR